jgi:ketosteroid isomerase-like protein
MIERRCAVKQRLVVVALLVFSQVTVFAAQDSKVEQDLRKLDDQRIAALVQNDFPKLEQIMSDDFTYTHSNGQVQTKAEFLGDFKSGKRVFRSLQQEDVQVRLYGSAALVTGRCTLTGTNGGKDFVLPMRFTEVYANNNGKWQWILWQSTRLTP